MAEYNLSDPNLSAEDLRHLLEFIGEVPPHSGQHIAEREFAAYSQGNLSEIKAELIDAHLAACAECAVRMEEVLTESETASDMGPRRPANRMMGSRTWEDFGTPRSPMGPMALREVNTHDLPKRRLLIDARTCDAIRSRTAQAQEIVTLRSRALVWVKAHQKELSPTECQDLISEALLDVLPLIQDPGVDVLVVDREFRKTLGSKRVAAKRRVRRFIGIEKLEAETEVAEDAENEIVQMDHLLKVARLLKSLIGIAADLLSSRSHDLIVAEYHLVPLGFSLRNPESPALSGGAYRVALLRARKRFHQILGVVCGAAQTTLREEAASLRASMEDARTLAAFSASNQPVLLDAIELLRLVKAAKGFIELAVDLLPDREHDLIIESYGLERLGFSLRNPATLFFPKDQDNKMLSQARAVFMETFGAVFAAAQMALEYGQDVTEHALKLVRGETVADILEVIVELEEKVSS